MRRLFPVTRYTDAIWWIVHNDCTEWVDDDTIAPIAALTAYIFNVSEGQVMRDLRDERTKMLAQARLVQAKKDALANDGWDLTNL